jgi:hypothetical protein
MQDRCCVCEIVSGTFDFVDMTSPGHLFAPRKHHRHCQGELQTLLYPSKDSLIPPLQPLLPGVLLVEGLFIKCNAVKVRKSLRCAIS